MKFLKKAIASCSIVGLIIFLSACGHNGGTQKTTTMADILNGKQERKIVMTYDDGHGDSPSVQWAGTIGNGKVEIYPYSNYNKNLESFEFNEIKNENMKNYKKTLEQKTKDYSKQKGKTLNIKPTKAKLFYRPDKKGDKADAIILHFKAKAYDDNEKFLMANKGYSVIKKDHPKNWLEIGTKDSSGNGWTQYNMFIEAKGQEKNLKKEDLKEVKKKYNNVEILDK